MSRCARPPKRILFIAPPYFGHLNQMIVLAQETSLSGHKVGLACSPLFRDRLDESSIEFLAWDPDASITDSSLLDRRATLWADASRDRSIMRGMLKMLKVVTDSYLPMRETLAPVVKAFQPDLIVADSAVTPAFDLADQLGIPYIVQLQFLGHEAPISSKYPRYSFDFGMRMSLPQRVINFLNPLLLAYFLPELGRLERVRRGTGARKPFRTLHSDSMVIVCSAFGVEIPRALPPLMKMVGPILPRQTKALSPELKAWLQDGNTPVIYMSFGTLATLERWQAAALVEGLTSSDWRVLWALRPAERHLLETVPSNFRIEEFVPQQAVLAEPPVQLFISHCGMNSTSEGLYHGKPMLALPFFGDQHYNAARIEDIGAGLRLRKRHFEAEEVRSKVQLLLHDRSYTAVAQKMAVVLNQMRGRDDAVRTIQDALLYGFDHLKPESLYAQAFAARPERRGQYQRN